jgi:hypothetical protein
MGKFIYLARKTFNYLSRIRHIKHAKGQPKWLEGLIIQGKETI